jgi:predicted dinucleotide-binding enzyme
VRIGIVGAGERGAALGQGLTDAGHQIAVADARDPSAAERLAGRLGPSVEATTPDEAAAFGDGVILSGPFAGPELLPSVVAAAGKVLIDAMNAGPEDEARLHGRPSSVVLSELFPDAVVVKALNALDPAVLRDQGRTGTPRERRLVVFLAGDSVRANARVSTLIEELGFAPVDTGTLLHGSRLFEPGTPLFGKALLPADAKRLLQLSRAPGYTSTS